MKRITYVLGLALASMALLLGSAQARQRFNGQFVNMAAPLDFTQTVDISDLDRFSMQATYSDGTGSSDTISDGAKSTVQITVTSNSYVLASTPTLIINGVTLTYIPVGTSTGTAKVISDAIMANSSLNTIIASSWTGTTTGVVYATAATVGVNAYSVTSSSWAALTPSNFAFSGGAASDVSTDDSFTQTSHGFNTGLKVLFQKTSGTDPTGLTSGTTYYVIKVNDNSYKLASSSTNAVAGTAVDITALTGSGSFGNTPLALVAGSAGCKWQASNDSVVSTWKDVNTSSVTYTAAGTTFWDFGQFNAKYLRLNCVGPTSGAILWNVTVYGKKDE